MFMKIINGRNRHFSFHLLMSVPLVEDQDLQEA